MNIVFVSENGFVGKVPDDFNNVRTEYAWMQFLDATHYHLGAIDQIPSNTDLIVFIIPKKIQPNYNISIVELLKMKASKVAVMQEGSFWNFQDMELPTQIWYSNEYATADFIFCHNESDAKYYRGIYDGKPVMVLRTAMNPSPITKTTLWNKWDFVVDWDDNATIIGGNFCSWYGGFDSYMVAQEFGTPIYAPKMGRKKDGEEQLVNILPYMNWSHWMWNLQTFKYGVHLMRTFGAGTFAMNCAWWGIPCIGYKGLDTQETLFPTLSVNVGDIESARSLARLLAKDEEYYKGVSDLAKYNVTMYSDKKKWLENFNEQYDSLQNTKKI